MLKELFSDDYKKYTVITLIAALSAIGLGTFLHFAFELSGKVGVVGFFAPVNESVWEHLKLVFFPFALSMSVEYFIYGKEIYNFFSSKLIGVSVGLVLVTVAYYVSAGAFGMNNMAVNIVIFVFSVLVSYVIAYFRMLKTPRLAGGGYEIAGIAIMVVIMLLFFIFTYFPPMIPLFRDPTDMSYSV